MNGDNLGMTLVELLFALTAMAVLLIALVAALTRTLADAQFTANRAKADRYVEEALELARNKRDEIGLDKLETNKVPNSPLPLPFKRTINITAESDEKKRVVVQVTWSDSRGTHWATGSSYLTEW